MGRKTWSRIDLIAWPARGQSVGCHWTSPIAGSVRPNPGSRKAGCGSIFTDGMLLYRDNVLIVLVEWSGWMLLSCSILTTRKKINGLECNRETKGRANVRVYIASSSGRSHRYRASVDCIRNINVESWHYECRQLSDKGHGSYIA